MAKALTESHELFVPKLEEAIERFERCSTPTPSADGGENAATVPSEHFYYLGKAALAAAVKCVRSQETSDGAQKFKLAADAFRRAIDANRDLLRPVVTKVELLFVKASRWKLVDLFSGPSCWCCSYVSVITLSASHR